MIGSALLRQLKKQAYTNVVDFELDTYESRQVEDFFSSVQPEYVFVTAGRSGGIKLNRDHPAELMLSNLLAGSLVIHNAHRFGIRKLLYLASSCCYPKHCQQPMKVESIMTGILEPTSDAYAVAKIACMKLCEAYKREHDDVFITGIPADAFGPGDVYDFENAHVLPALLRKMHEAARAKSGEVVVWGSGKPRREFVFVDDLADACLFVMQHYEGHLPVNLGGGTELSIAELAEAIRKVVGYSGKIVYDLSYPDGMLFKALDSSILLEMGWKPITSFQRALQITYQDFLNSSGRAFAATTHQSEPDLS